MYLLKHYLSLAIALWMLAISVTAVQATPPFPTIPQRIQITVEAVDAPAALLSKLDQTIPEGNNKAALILEAIVRDQMSEVHIIRLQTSNNFPGIATYDRMLGFTDKDHPGKNYVTLETSLEATPHLEGNDHIRVNLTTLFTEIGSVGLPNTVGRRITMPTSHFRSGETAMFPGMVINILVEHKKPAEVPSVQVLFITVVILPMSSGDIPVAGK